MVLANKEALRARVPTGMLEALAFGDAALQHYGSSTDSRFAR